MAAGMAAGAASSRSTATGCRCPTAPRSSRCSRAGRRWFRRARCRSATGCEVYLKVEGANPTGSFKDRGMTMAISKACEEGSQAVICASTGNTSASAAAYAARAGLTCAVLVPDRQDRAGQARAGAGARRQAAGGRRQLRRLPDAGPRPRRALPGHAGQLRQPGTASRGRRPRRSRSATRSAPRPTCTACRSATPATSPRTGRATREYAATARPPRMLGFQAAGAAPIVAGRVGAEARRRSRPRSASATRRRGSWPWPPGTSPAASSRRSPTGRSSTPTGCWPPARACSSSRPARPAWPGCCRRRADGAVAPGARVVCTVTGHGLKDPDWAICGAREAGADRRRTSTPRRARWGCERPRLAARPGDAPRRRCGSGCPRRAPTSGRGSTRSGSRWACTTTSSSRRRPPGCASTSTGEGAGDVAARRAPPRGRRRRARPSTALRRRSRRAASCAAPTASRTAAGWARRRRPSWPGCAPRARSRRRTTASTRQRRLALASRIEGHPDNVAACVLGGLTIAWYEGAAPRAARLQPCTRAATGGLRARGPHLDARPRAACCPTQVPHADAARNAARAALLVHGADRATRRCCWPRPRTGCTSRTALPALPASAALVGALRAAGIPAVLSGAGPTVLALARTRPRRRSPSRSR